MRPLGLAPGKFVWIPNGVDPGALQSNAISDRPFVRHIEALRDQGFFVVIYAGAHGEPNALEALVSSGALLEQRGIKAKIVLVGKGERKAHLLKLAREQSGNSVEFHDQQPKEDIMAALKLASAGYISLRSRPIFRFGVSPNKLWDYMMMGLPVIFACIAGNDPVATYNCGLSVDPECPEQIAEAIEQMSLLTEEERRAIGRRGHEAVIASYTYAVLAQKVIQSIDSELST